jgi:uncharacterized membrane protein YjgN (DUF898 family)
MDQTAAAPAPSPALIYDGKISDLYRIFALNLLFKILTLGIFRFWAITRYRRYIWSRMQFQGERFEYIGTGGQLFVGYLLAGVILVGAAAITGLTAFICGKLWHPLTFLPFVVFYFFVGVLATGAVFSAQRYRLTRTLWCGIHGGMKGSMFGYGLRATFYGFIAGLTWLQMVPWIQVRLAERRINASSFGNVAFRFHGQARRIYLAYLLTFLGGVLLFVIVSAVAWSILQGLPFGLLTSPLPADALAKAALTRKLTWTLTGGLIVFVTLARLLGCWYKATFDRHVAGNATLGTVRFTSTLTGHALFGLTLGNTLLMLLTLGLGYPVVLHRNARMLARTLQAEGALDASMLRQSTLSASRFAEGMFHQLDAGAVL